MAVPEVIYHDTFWNVCVKANYTVIIA